MSAASDEAKSVILVTGATGNVGSNVVSGLLDIGAAVRALVRDAAAARLPAGADVVQGDLTASDTIEAAIKGVDTVFLLWPYFDSEAAAPVVEALAGHARRVVYLSSENVREDTETYRGSLEWRIERSALEWTFLRPTGFASNTLLWADQIRRGDVVRWPFAGATRSLIHERDIADVAVRALTDEALVGARPILSGPEALTQVEQVQALGEGIGRQLRFEEISRDTARAQLVETFGDASFADTALDAWAAMVDEPEVVTSTVPEITGSPARSLGRWARDHAEDFR